MSEIKLVNILRMRTVLQRCERIEVTITDRSCGSMSAGLMLLMGFAQTLETLPQPMAEQFLALSADAQAKELEPLFQKWWDKVSALRIFSDEQGKMNLSLVQQPADVGVYLVSQFTLFADMRKGNRPSFSGALSAPVAKVCFDALVSFVRSRCESRPVMAGVFAADMKVSLTNDGPVTLMFDVSSAEGLAAL